MDNFWFVIAHEIAHVLHHFDYLKEPILDNLDEKAVSERELEADRYAGIYLNQDKVVSVGQKFGKYLNSERLMQISESSDVSVPVALGMLQHMGLLEWRQFAKFKSCVKSFLTAELVFG